MNFNGKTLLTLLAVFAVVGSGVAGAVGGYALNPDAEQHPDMDFKEDQLTVESHNRTTMGWLQYEGDNGSIQTVDAHVNGTESGAMVSYRADQIDADALLEYPRKGSEDGNNSATWSDSSNWSSSGVTVTDTDGSTAPGVESLKFETSGSLTSGGSEHATYADQDITDDAEKRYLQVVMNVDSLEASAELAVQVRDANGDYVEAVINSSRDATANDVIANQTGSGIIYQEQLGQLTVEGTGDGNLDGIQEIRVEARDGDATATVTGLNVQKKSRWDFGDERVLDTETEATDDYKSETVYNRPAGGAINATDLSGMGDTFQDATLNKLSYLNVEYRLQDKPSAVTVEFREDNNYPSFPFVLDVSWRRTIPTAYDLTHGNIVLEANQSFLGERYTQFRYAEGVGDTATENVSSDSWIDLTGSLGEKGKTISVDNTVQTDTTYVVQQEIKLVESQKTALEAQQNGTGFWGSDGGSGPFQSLYNWIAGGVAMLLTAIGIKSRGG